MEFLPGTIVKFIRERIRYFSGVAISWFGGEPLLVPDVIQYISEKVIAMCDKMKKTYTASMTTNGSLLTPDMMKLMLKCKVLSYQITIDGTEKYHDKYRHLINGGKTFNTIMKNLISIKKSFKTGIFHIALRSNFTKESFEEFEEYTNFFNATFEGDRRFSVFLRAVGNFDSNQENSITKVMLDNGIAAMCSCLLKKGLSVPLANNIDFLEPGGCICYAGLDNHYVFDSVGKIRKCTVALDEDYNIVGEIKNGSFILYKHSLAKWISPMNLHTECEKIGRAHV